jgi:hypothetical protein
LLPASVEVAIVAEVEKEVVSAAAYQGCGDQNTIEALDTVPGIATEVEVDELEVEVEADFLPYH